MVETEPQSNLPAAGAARPGVRRDARGWGGVLVAPLFVASLVLAGVLARGPLPLPGAPVADVARYFAGNRAAVLAAGALQALAACALLAFVPGVAAALRRGTPDADALVGPATGAGIIAALFQILSAGTSLALAAVAGGGATDTVGTLRNINFYAGGVGHIVALALFVGVSAVIALGGVLPRWLAWLGIVAAVPAALSLLSLLIPPASLLLSLGRVLCLIWSIAVGIALIRGRTGPARRDVGAR